MAENRDIANLSDDEVYRSLSYRANVIAYLKAMTLYVAQGYIDSVLLLIASMPATAVGTNK